MRILGGRKRVHQLFNACSVPGAEAESRGYDQMSLSKSHIWVPGVQPGAGIDVVATQRGGEERGEGGWRWYEVMKLRTAVMDIFCEKNYSAGCSSIALACNS